MDDQRPKTKTFTNGRQGEALWTVRQGTESSVAKRGPERPMYAERLMEVIVSNENVTKALERVERNKGAAGSDGMEVNQLRGHLRKEWAQIRRALLSGTYRPHPVFRVEIPKPGKREKRKLGIPTVMDRFIQQAILQILQGPWDQSFSDHSYGFREGRSAHQAIAKAQSYIAEGYMYVVDIDLAQFFDRICHDRLMSKLAESIKDKRVLKIIRAFLNAGIMVDGLIQPTTEGAPQGGPLTPRTQLTLFPCRLI